MGAFFNGWRRKAGCVALAMALALMAGWVRSLVVFDMVNIPAGKRNSFGIQSKRQSLCFSWTQQNSAGEIAFPFVWLAMDPSIRGTELSSDYTAGEFGCLVNLGDEYPHGIILTGPYWSVTLPLTLLSAYLILWKPLTKLPSSSQPDNTIASHARHANP